MNPYEQFQKKKEYLICIDSDGCVMDTMDIKHMECFGPMMIITWQLQAFETDVLAYWNQVNLYSMTRGINRFKALALVLKMVDETYIPIDGIAALLSWVENSDQLSEAAIKQQLAAAPEPMLARVLFWSQTVNDWIRQLPPDQMTTFAGVASGLELLGRYADTAVVSSANYEAVLEEWERFGLLPYMNVVLAQNAGSKADCIRQLLQFGYEPDHVLMIGDAPGDLTAAKANGILFYPILTTHEQESWQGIDLAVKHLRGGTYRSDFEPRMEAAFIENLNR